MAVLRRQLERIRAWFRGRDPHDALMPPRYTDWCLVGDVVDAGRFDDAGETRRVAKRFAPGTNVYCLPPQWGDGFEQTVVVGVARNSGRWITVVMPTRLIARWRAKIVRQHAIARRLRE